MATAMELISALKVLGTSSFSKTNNKMSQGELAVLNALKLCGPLTPTKICEVTHMSSAHTAKTICALKMKKQIDRVVSEDDKRKALISLTDAGEVKINELHQQLLQQFEELVQYLGEEDSDNLIRIIYKISKKNEVK